MRDLTIPEQRHPEKAHRKDNQQPKKQAGSVLRLRRVPNISRQET